MTQFDAIHRCEDQDCPSFGQRTFSQCGCHKTVETMLREEVTRLTAVDRAKNADLSSTVPATTHSSPEAK